MINLYDKNCTDFNNNGLVLSDCKSCFIDEALNGKFELTLEYPLDSRGKWQYLTEGNIIKADGQLFRIYHKQKTLNGVLINARHIFYDLLDNFLEDVRPTNLNGAGALDWILTHTQYTHPFESMSDVETIATKYFVRTNPVNAIMGQDGIIANWGGELVRDNFTIKLLQARGLDRGVLISYGKNIQGIEETLDISGIITRLMPIGKDGLLLTEKYIDSPLINSYPHPVVRTIEFSDCETEDALRTAATAYMAKGVDVPNANYKINFLELTKTEEYKNYAILETVYLGDTVHVKHEKLGLNLSCKAIRIKKQIYPNGKTRITEIELGNFKPTLSDSFQNIGNKIDDTNTKIDTTKTDLQQAIDNSTSLIKTALGGYVYKAPGILAIMDTPDPNTCVHCWLWDLGGLGYSSTGFNGEFRTAIDMQGHVCADFITTGVLSALLIKTGVLKSADGSSWINLDNGTFSFGGGRLSFDGDSFVIDFTGTALEAALNGKASQADMDALHSYMNFDDTTGLRNL